ncbi:hypothetical protein JNUCC31_04310 [Paenibacillus sp. JNUCC31]|uniref:hypothetical protein n=1 Tax=Paenibacillus sp. JNUCC-31 TaxID=2777983 RepID=UPI00177BF040|nr:hypothetical protein [Paenibacillus sp. JNUCC-31]QOS80170.1 hypothetical protein JNUCC31_04310 [Paenibacillus sp. JNUCC-31]
MKSIVTLTHSEEDAKFIRIMSNPKKLPNVTVGKTYPIKWEVQFENVGEEMYIIDDNGNKYFQVRMFCKTSLYAL